MQIDERKVVNIFNYLKQKGVGNIPSIILGFQKYPELNSPLDEELRVIQNELLKYNIVEKESNSLNGYIYIRLTNKGMAMSQKEIEQLFNNDSFIEDTIDRIVMRNIETSKKKKEEYEEKRILEIKKEKRERNTYRITILAFILALLTFLISSDFRKWIKASWDALNWHPNLFK